MENKERKEPEFYNKSEFMTELRSHVERRLLTEDQRKLGREHQPSVGEPLWGTFELFLNEDIKITETQAIHLIMRSIELLRRFEVCKLDVVKDPKIPVPKMTAREQVAFTKVQIEESNAIQSLVTMINSLK